MYEPQKRPYGHPKYKTAYRVKNWPEYERSLKDRGDIIVWLSKEAIKAWIHPKNGKCGGQRSYSDLTIETSLTLRLIFHLPLKQTGGFLGSIFKLMDLDLPCPDHTTLSRRNRSLKISNCINSFQKAPVRSRAKIKSHFKG